MDWPALLASTARLLDLHDCDRAAGASLYAPPEVRPGPANGLWLDVATQMLQYLYEKDLEANEAWISLTEIVDDLVSRHDIDEQDVLFVTNYLATSTRLVTLKEGVVSSTLDRLITKKETALIEWPRNTNARNRCRLTPSGSRSVQLSQAADKWLYADEDASKLIKAIEYGAFPDLPALAEGLIAQIRGFSKEITILLERKDLDELLDEFRQRKDEYLAVLKGVQGSVEKAYETFMLTDTLSRFDSWVDSTGNEDITSYTIVQSFRDILQAIERLSRKLQGLLSVLVSQKREIIGSVQFDKAAVGLAFYPCAENIVELCIRALGPWTTMIGAPAPSDFTGILSLPLEEESETTYVFEEEIADELPSPLQQFLDSYGGEISSALKKGPVSLTKAVENGWLMIDGIDVLPQLVGIYASPDWIEEEGAEIAVSLLPGALNVELPDGGRLRGDDVVLHLLLTNSENKGID